MQTPKDFELDTPDSLMAAIMEGKNADRVRTLLIQHPEWVTLRLDNGITFLHFACLRTFQEAAEALYKAGAKFDTPDEEGNTPLHFAFEDGRGGIMPIIQWMAAKGIPFHTIENIEGKSPLRFNTEGPGNEKKAEKLYRLLGSFDMKTRLQLIGDFQNHPPITLPPWLQGLATNSDDKMRRLYDTRSVVYRGSSKGAFPLFTDHLHYDFSPGSRDLLYPETKPVAQEAAPSTITGHEPAEAPPVEAPTPYVSASEIPLVGSSSSPLPSAYESTMEVPRFERADSTSNNSLPELQANRTVPIVSKLNTVDEIPSIDAASEEVPFESPLVGGSFFQSSAEERGLPPGADEEEEDEAPSFDKK